MTFRVQRGTNIYEFELRTEAVDYAREISENGESVMFYETTLAREQLNYKNGELISFRSENIKRGR